MSDLLDKATSTEADQSDTNEGTVTTLTELVGEGKKFGTTEDLAKGKVEADKFIDQLKDENAEMRQALAEAEERAAKAVALTDVVDEIRRQSSQTGDTPTPVTEEALTKLVDQKLSEREAQQTTAENRRLVESTILEAFEGNETDAVNHVNKRVAELGLDKGTVNALSNSNPKAFLKLMGLDGEPTKQSPQPSLTGERAVDSEKRSQLGNRKNYQYYSQLRKEMGVAKYYANHALLNEMYQEKERQGEDFFK